jgi:hypothetical protein
MMISSVVSKVPAGVRLGHNTCYFISSEILGRGVEDAHLEVARMSIEEAFATQGSWEVSPWLPVAPENDPSRGWLRQDGTTFTVRVTEPQTGWFPQFGIGQEAFHLAYATKA